jgi:hypothetical protein
VEEISPDKVVLASEEEILPADVFSEEDDLLPADVVLDDEEVILPADVFLDVEEELLPADVVLDIEIEIESALALATTPQFFADTGAEFEEVSSSDADGFTEDSPPVPQESEASDEDSADGEAAS